VNDLQELTRQVVANPRAEVPALMLADEMYGRGGVSFAEATDFVRRIRAESLYRIELENARRLLKLSPFVELVLAHEMVCLCHAPGGYSYRLELHAGPDAPAVFTQTDAALAGLMTVRRVAVGASYRSRISSTAEK